MGTKYIVRWCVLATTWLICVDFAACAVAGSTSSAADSGPGEPAGVAEASAPANPPPQQRPAANSGKVEDLLNLDIDQLSKVSVGGGAKQTNLTSPSSQISGSAADTGEATSTADLLTQAPSVTTRRVSAITFDPRVRGYHSSQLNATANGMNQLKARLDIDTLFSQIDPGVVQNITVVDGPYTSLYGPGFAFMIADLLPAPRFETPQTHLSSNFVYGSNAQTLYSRDNVITGGKDWGACVSYGLRDGNDYRTGGENGYLIPSRYQKWDGFVAASFDLSPLARLEFNYLRTEMNGVELPGVVYDIQNSMNDQYNLRYIVQEDPKGPKQLELQAWYTQTFYYGDASNASKQTSFYHSYMTEPSWDWVRPSIHKVAATWSRWASAPCERSARPMDRSGRWVWIGGATASTILNRRGILKAIWCGIRFTAYPARRPTTAAC